jgi:hypothetical protein
METLLTHESADVRYRWVFDDDYDPSGSWGLDEPEQSEVVADETAKLNSGELIAVGCIAERRCPCCGAWNVTDSLWGIVVSSLDDPYVGEVEQDMDTRPTTRSGH